MTKIELGEWIEVNGKRPDWLRDDENFAILWSDGTAWDHLYTPAYCVSSWENSVVAIRLRADHPYYHGIAGKDQKLHVSEIYGMDHDEIIDFLRKHGLVQSETILEKYQREHGLSDSERGAVEAFIEWQNKENNK